jgi:hypothetical protein
MAATQAIPPRDQRTYFEPEWQTERRTETSDTLADLTARVDGLLHAPHAYTETAWRLRSNIRQRGRRFVATLTRRVYCDPPGGVSPLVESLIRKYKHYGSSVAERRADDIGSV